jgi:hypothetical protein
LFKYFLIKVFSVANGLRILVKPIPAFAFILLRKLRKDIGSIGAMQLALFLKIKFSKTT